MQSFRNQASFFLSLVATALFVALGTSGYGKETGGSKVVAPAVWDAPSAKVDSAVATWATERLRPRSASVPAAKPVDSPAAIDAFQGIDRAVAPPINRVEPVRFEQPVGQESAGSNPLRLTTQPASPQLSVPSPRSDAARLAFTENAPSEASKPTSERYHEQPEPRPLEPNPIRLKIGATPVRQLAPVKRSAEPYRLATQSIGDEPRTFEPARNAVLANTMNEEPSIVTIPEEAFATGVTPVVEPPATTAPPAFKPYGTELVTPQNPIQVPRQEAGQGTGRDSRNDWSDTAPATFQEGVGKPSKQGTGRPGGRELNGPQEGSLVVEKRGPEEVRVGQTSRFLITVRNTSQSTAKNVALYDEIPEGAELVGAIPPAARENGRLAWRLGSIAPGEERSVEVRVKPLREGTIGSVASVSFETMASAAMRSTRPQLAIRIRAAERVLVGKKQLVQIELHNPGTGMATGVVLVEDVPDNLRHEAGPELEMEIGTLAPGETRRLDLTLTAAQAGRAVNTVTAFANGDLRAEKSIAFDVVAASLDVSIDGPKRRYLERPATYTININNPGSAPAKEVRLVTHLPQGLKFVSANNMGEYDNQTHSVYWSLAELPEGERGAVEVVGLPITAGEHTLRVEGEALNGLKATESQRLLIEGIASLAFDVRDLQDPIEVGAEAAYDVVVTNEGTKAASAVRVVLEAPVGMKVVSAKGHTAHRLSDDRVEFAPIARLEPGVKVLYRVRLRGELPGDQRVTVSVESEDLRTPIRREESTRVFGDE